MFNKKLIALFIVLIIAIISVSSCSSDSKKDKTKRRNDSSNTSTTKKQNTLPPISSSTSVASQDTKPIVEKPFLSANEISIQYNQIKLCSLFPTEKAKEVLNMQTDPTQKYSFNNSTGATCTYSSGAGDEIYIQLSVSSYADARSVDNALNASGTPVVISKVGGVEKINKAVGTTYELNVSGEKSNEWIVNAPKTEQAKKIAEALIKSIG